MLLTSENFGSNQCVKKDNNSTAFLKENDIFRGWPFFFLSCVLEAFLILLSEMFYRTVKFRSALSDISGSMPGPIASFPDVQAEQIMASLGRILIMTQINGRCQSLELAAMHD